MLKTGDKIKILWDDANPHLNGKIGTVVQPPQLNSPYWTRVDVEGVLYPVRGAEVQLLCKSLVPKEISNGEENKDRQTS